MPKRCRDYQPAKGIAATADEITRHAVRLQPRRMRQAGVWPPLHNGACHRLSALPMPLRTGIAAVIVAALIESRSGLTPGDCGCRPADRK